MMFFFFLISNVLFFSQFSRLFKLSFVFLSCIENEKPLTDALYFVLAGSFLLQLSCDCLLITRTPRVRACIFQ